MDENNNAPNLENPDTVPYIVFQYEMARQERHVKRLLIALVVAICACVAITVGFLLYLNEYDFASYEQDGHGVNIIGDSNGVDYNVPASEETHKEESLDG